MKNGHSKGGEEENVVASTDLYTSPMRHTLSDLATECVLKSAISPGYSLELDLRQDLRPNPNQLD